MTTVSVFYFLLILFPFVRRRNGGRVEVVGTEDGIDNPSIDGTAFLVAANAVRAVSSVKS
jgi:hypothetical protein